MEITINGKEWQEDLSEQITLAELLQQVQVEQVGPEEVLTRVCLDGQALTAQTLSFSKNQPIKEFADISIEIQSRKFLAAQALRLITQRLRESETLRTDLVQQLSQGYVAKASEQLPEYLQIWQAVQQNLAAAVRVMNLDLEKMEVFDQSDPAHPQARSIGQILQILAEQLQQIKEALQAGDIVLLRDILDYEFAELAQAWDSLLLQLADFFEAPE